MPHKTTTLAIHGHKCKIDTAIVPLIEIMNSIPRVRTLNCCEGNLGLGYVQFSGQDALTFVLNMATEITGTFKRIGMTYTIGKQKYGRHFEVEVGDGEFTMRWDSRSFAVVLDAAKIAASCMNTIAEEYKNGENIPNMKLSLSIDFDNGESHHSNITVEDNKVSINAYQQHSSSTPRDNTYRLAGNDEQTLLTKGEAASYVGNYIQRVLNEAFDIKPATFQASVER